MSSASHENMVKGSLALHALIACSAHGRNGEERGVENLELCKLAFFSVIYRVNDLFRLGSSDSLLETDRHCHS